MSEEKKINNLQQIINKRAEDKLNADIQEISKYLQTKSNLLRKVQLHYTTTKNSTQIDRTLDDLLYWQKELRTEVYNANIEDYIKKETKLFLEEIEGSLGYMQELQEQLSYLQ
jgi:hypothetical protein